MIITHKIKMDLTLRKIHALDFVQGSSTTPFVQIELFSNNQHWEIPDGATVLIRYRKPNLKTCVYDTMPDGSSAGTISSNCVTIAIAPDALSLPGECFLVVSLVLGDQEVSSFKLTLRIQANPALGDPMECPPTTVSGMLPTPKVSRNGQFIAVEEVNDHGKVTKTKAVDLPELAFSPDKIHEVVAAYLEDNPPPAGETGPQGPKGDTGDVGPQGPAGEPGADGKDGKSAYQYACDGGYTGTEETFAAKLAVEMPKTFYVDILDNGDMTGTISKPYEEIMAAFEAGSPIVGTIYLDSETAAGNVMLGVLDGMLIGTCAGFNAGNEPTIFTTVIYNGGVSCMGIKAAPESLPNPHKLIFTGAAAGEYDGSGEVTINIPASGGDTDTKTVLSDNLFDKSAALYGQHFYYGSSGYEIIAQDYKYAHFVPLRGAGTYRTKFMKQVHSSTGTRIALANEANEWVMNVTGTLAETAEDPNYVDFEFEVTSTMITQGASKIVFDVYSPYIDQVMIVKDRDYPSEYIPYGYIEVATESGRKVNNGLYEKTAVFLGDSLCAGTTVIEGSAEYGYGWGGLIGEANKMIWKNYGQNGAVITTSITQTNRYIPTQVDTAISEHPGADYIIFDGGTNDSAYTELGTLSKAGYAPTDYADFTNAFESMLLKILTAFPKAKIGYIIPPKMNRTNDFSSENNEYRQFFDRAIEICEKWGVPYIDLWKTSPLNPMLPVHYDSALTATQANAQGKFYTDGQHLTLAGYQRLAPQIEAWMRTL